MELLQRHEKTPDCYNIDALTGLYNRGKYERDIRMFQATGYERLTCVYMDVVGLHEVNNHLGHEAGDKMLCMISDAIREYFPKSLAYRIGGDEFCCIIPKGKSVDIERVIRKLYHDVDVLNNKRIIPTEVGIACGYAVFTVDDMELERVRERADEEMYQRKKEMKM